MQYTLDRYCSICSAIKCPLEITADDYFVTSNGAVYDAIQAAYIVLRIMGYYINAFHAYQVPSFCLLQSVYLIVCFVHVSVCASVQLEMSVLKFWVQTVYKCYQWTTKLPLARKELSHDKNKKILWKANATTTGMSQRTLGRKPYRETA